MTMRELPILFSTPMVKANLEGRKTMTRRILPLGNHELNFCGVVIGDKKRNGLLGFGKGTKIEETIKPKYQPGDLLWVRETMGFNKNSETYWPIADGYVKTADYEKIIPSIHVPKIHSRIWLKVTNVRVERLHDINEDDIIKEGVQIPCNNGKPVFILGEDNSAVNFLPTGCLADNAPALTQMQLLYAHFAELWCKINGRESWDSNPWVWVIEYEILSTTGKPAIVFLDEYAEITNEQRNKLKEAFSL